MISVRYLNPTERSFDETLLGWLLAELPSASVLRLATGYFDGSVLDWLEEPLEDLLKRGGSMSAVIGSNSGATERADLKRLLDVIARDPASTLHVEYAEGGIFHPKVFVVESPSRVAALIGSANLTAPGSIVNVEAGVVLATDEPGPPPEPPLDAIINSIDPVPRPDAFCVASSGDLDRLESLGMIGRIVRSTVSNVTPARATAQRHRRQRSGVRTRPGVSGIPPRTRRPSTAGPTITPAPGLPAAARDFYGVEFTANDLKDIGTREFSVSRSLRDWAERVLTRPIVPGEGSLFDMIVEGRLAASPMSIARTPEPVRIWAAGGSGGTHADVRFVLGNHLKAALDDEAVQLTGLPMPGGSIGVFEPPAHPQLQPVRLTIFLPSDANYAAVAALLARSGREQKKHFRVAALPQMPRWP